MQLSQIVFIKKDIPEASKAIDAWPIPYRVKSRLAHAAHDIFCADTRYTYPYKAFALRLRYTHHVSEKLTFATSLAHTLRRSFTAQCLR